MEKAKITMIGVIVFLSIVLLAAWTMKKPGGLLDNKPNWQWSNDWNSDQMSNPPSPNQPIPNNPNPNNPDTPMNAQNFEQAKEMSAKSGRPILAIFGATWCSWCKKLEQETLSDASVRSLMNNYVYVKVDADTEKILVSKYKVRGLPTIIIIDANESEIKKDAGFKDVNKMKDFLK